MAVTDRRTAEDFGAFLRWLVDDVYPEAERVVLVTDNRSAHAAGSPYEAFDPATARRVIETVEWHDTPKHGSRLNVAECGFAILARQCPSRRTATIGDLRRRVAGWENERDDRLVEARWRFTAADARIKLRRLDPSTQ